MVSYSSDFEQEVFDRFGIVDESISDFKLEIVDRFGVVNKNVSVLRTDVDGLKTDVGGLKEDVDGLKTDVGGLKTDVGTLKTEVGGLRGDVRRLELLYEETDSKIDTILEIVSSDHASLTQTKDHQHFQDEQLLFHERRLNLLEKGQSSTA